MEKYSIYVKGRKIYREIDETTMLDVMQELADSYYNTGSPNPDDVEVKSFTKVTKEN